jgi:formylglycine-generating enzyme required for sulfatase activity
VIGKDPEAVAAQEYRAIALARLGRKPDALAELAKFQKGEIPEPSRLHLAVVVAAELGEGAEKAIAALDAALQEQPRDDELGLEAARALALASKALARRDQAQGRQLVERSLHLLRESVQKGDTDFGKLDEDPDLDPVRDDPAFTEVMKAGHPQRRYAAVWSSDARFEGAPILGIDPAAHLSRCRDLIAQGYRPVSLSVCRTLPEGPLAAASVWHRPVVSEEVKDRLAERQARAAIALIRLGRADEVWPLLRHSADPRLRSFIVNWLKPLGADPEAVVAELDRLEESVRRGSPDPAETADRRSPPSGRPSVALVARSGDLATTKEDSPATRYPGHPKGRATQKMDAILFHPETSTRRALILALGTYGADGRSPGEQEPLIARLLVLYRNDPDAGIHGSIARTLRQWSQQAKLKAADAELSQLKQPGYRRWFVNGQGQTFAVIDGPVSFRMGSPPTEPERIAGNEPLRRMMIPRRFAIAASEVTVEQFQRFAKANPGFGVPPGVLNRYTPDPAGPTVVGPWYAAAAYCNWLSEQEGIPRDQWCYEPGAGGYVEGMRVPADVLRRTGYRLPTEAEWEYACRSGTVTSRYYGHSIELLEAYARYQGNSKEHAWSCGSLLPNDLGLFDMLGNMFEWCQDRHRESTQGRRVYDDNISISELLMDKHPRLLRGGAFTYRPASVRSAYRSWDAPTNRSIDSGFRLARTYN